MCTSVRSDCSFVNNAKYRFIKVGCLVFFVVVWRSHPRIACTKWHADVSVWAGVLQLEWTASLSSPHGKGIYSSSISSRRRKPPPRASLSLSLFIFCPRRAPIQYYSPFYFLFCVRKELHLQLRSHTSSDSSPPPLKSKHFSLNASLSLSLSRLDRLLVKYYLRPHVTEYK